MGIFCNPKPIIAKSLFPDVVVSHTQEAENTGMKGKCYFFTLARTLLTWKGRNEGWVPEGHIHFA